MTGEPESWKEHRRGQIALCKEWILLQGRTKGMNTRHTSYGYKHIVEKWSDTYIENSSFVQAVKDLEIPYKWDDKMNLNLIVPLSEKTIKKYRITYNYGKADTPALKRGQVTKEYKKCFCDKDLSFEGAKC